jgi:hypothetical protein
MARKSSTARIAAVISGRKVRTTGIAAAIVCAAREMSAAACVADRTTAATACVATAACMAAATTTAAAMLRQCRPCARQDQSQRAYRQHNAFALDNHLPLLTSAAYGGFTKTCQ